MISANFAMGQSPANYVSTNVAELKEKDASRYANKAQRLSTQHRYQRTNFTADKQGFEKKIDNGDFGP